MRTTVASSLLWCPASTAELAVVGRSAVRKTSFSAIGIPPAGDDGAPIEGPIKRRRFVQQFFTRRTCREDVECLGIRILLCEAALQQPDGRQRTIAQSGSCGANAKS